MQHTSEPTRQRTKISFSQIIFSHFEPTPKPYKAKKIIDADTTRRRNQADRNHVNMSHQLKKKFTGLTAELESKTPSPMLFQYKTYEEEANRDRGCGTECWDWGRGSEDKSVGGRERKEGEGGEEGGWGRQVGGWRQVSYEHVYSATHCWQRPRGCPEPSRPMVSRL